MEHGAYRTYRGGCRCAECKEANRQYCAEYRARYKSESGTGYYAQYERPGRPKAGATCLGCGEPVRGAYRKDRPFHRACRERVERAERKRELAAKRLERSAAGSSSSWAWVVGDCAQCLTYFVRHGRASSFCSTACSRKARPTRRQFKVSRRTRLAIYDRDNWTCQICMDEVDADLMTLEPLNDWAPSLDHIEPRSWALVPDHSPRNLRLAHRWCNSVRGDTSYYTDDDLRVDGLAA